MNYIQTEIDGVWLIEPKVFHDARGYFMEAFKEEEFRAHVGNVHFIQDNESKSSFGVLRGLHYQKGDCSQAKLVRVIKGKVLDADVLAVNDPVNAKVQKDGFAHGFLVLSDEAVFTYKVDNVYAPQSEASIRFDDEAIGIEWPVATEQLLLSDKDGHAVSFKDAVYYE